MRIKKLTAHFGTLDGATLTPGEGLTVINAPNEGGKSTWAAFWRAMLYGIDTRERDRAGFLADKNRFQPWSGAPMSGELEAEWEGQDIIVRRYATKSSLFGGFEAVYAESGDRVPGLTGKNLGEKLIGAGREVYLRSAFVGQGNSAIGQNGELEARISALAASGQEDTSFTDAERRLKDWRNRRRLNRSVGLMPELEGELARMDDTLDRMARAREVREQAVEQLARLEAEREELCGALSVWERINRQALEQRYRDAAEDLGRASSELSALSPPDSELAGLSAEQAQSWAREREAEFDAALRRREDALARRMEAQQRGKRPARLMLAAALVFAVLGLMAAFLNALEVISPNFFFYAGVLIGAIVMLSARRSVQSRWEREAESIEIPPPPEHLDWQGRADRHAACLSRKQQLEDDVRHQRQRLEDLRAQGAGLSEEELEDIPAPRLPEADASSRLRVVEQALARFRDELSHAEGALSQLGDPLELEARREMCAQQLSRRQVEYDAIDCALDVLSQANQELRRRFSPSLADEAGSIFAALTGGRWSQLDLAQDFSARVFMEPGSPPRSALALSAGTTELLYLAVRLAICNLSLPGAPIFLDDTLCSFDDARMERTLRFLLDLGRQRQVLLFSCHRREALWAAAHEVPVIMPELNFEDG